MLWTTLISFILKHWMDAFNYHLSFLLLIFFICFRQCLLNIYVICNNRSLSLNIKLEYKEMHSLITREELRFIVAFQTLRLNISVGQLFIPRLSNNSLVLLSALSPTSVTYYLGDSWFLRFIYIKKNVTFDFQAFHVGRSDYSTRNTARYLFWVDVCIFSVRFSEMCLFSWYR